MLWTKLFTLPPKFICWRSNPQTNGTWKWDFWKIMFRWGHAGKAVMMGLVSFRRMNQRTCSPSLHPIDGRTQREDGQQSASQEESSHQNLTTLTPWSQTSSLHNYEKINFCCSNPQSMIMEARAKTPAEITKCHVYIIIHCSITCSKSWKYASIQQ